MLCEDYSTYYPRELVCHALHCLTYVGLLPFRSIFIKMYFVFTSFWIYKISSKWIMISETIKFYCLSWTGVLCLWLYVTTFLNPHHSHCISRFSQTSFYVGYTLMFCLGLGIICGTVGYLDSTLFVRKIC
ncbi:unnamed protein product [Musa acuminata subsp. burmannicoides]